VRIILKWILKEEGWGSGLDSSGSGYGLVAGSCEHNNEPLGSIKYWEYLWAWATVDFSRRIQPHWVLNYVHLILFLVEFSMPCFVLRHKEYSVGNITVVFREPIFRKMRNILKTLLFCFKVYLK
jgi:hypothetical protein